MQLWLKASAEPTDHKRPLAFLPLRRLAPAQISLENVSNNLKNTEKKLHSSFEQRSTNKINESWFVKPAIWLLFTQFI